MIPLHWLDPNDGCSIGRNSSIAHYNLYPNTFCHQLSPASSVTLRVYDVLGREIATLVKGEQKVGQYEVEWNGLDDRGKHVASGVCFYGMQTEKFSVVRKMILLA